MLRYALINERCKCLCLIHCTAKRRAKDFNSFPKQAAAPYSPVQLQFSLSRKLLNCFIIFPPRLNPVSRQEFIISLHISRR